MPGLDAKLAAAFRDVPVPRDLAIRLLAGLQAAGAESPAAVIECAPVAGRAAVVGHDSEALASENPANDLQPSISLTQASDSPLSADRWSRRRMLWSAALAASFMIGIGAWCYWPRNDGPVNYDTLTASWYSTIDGANWRPLPPPGRFAVPKAISARALRWQPAASSVGNGVVFDVSRPGAAPAILFVVKGAMAGVPSVPPTGPQSDTSGRVGAAWQAGGLLYLLVIDGNERDYHSYVGTPELAWQPPRKSPAGLPDLPDRYGRPGDARFVKSS